MSLILKIALNGNPAYSRNLFFYQLLLSEVAVFPRKYRIHAILILSVLAIIIVPQITNKPDKNKDEATIISALEFLQMVDAGKYADSWQITDPNLQKNIPQNSWEKQMTEIRATFGEFVKRELEDVSFTAPSEELPDREFIMLEFSSQFKLKEMNEIVTVVLGKDQRWRVVGYFVQ